MADLAGVVRPAADGDYCPARVTPLPSELPRFRQLRAVVQGDRLLLIWLDFGGGVCRLELPSAGRQVRQNGCRCVANPRLLAEEADPGTGGGCAGRPGPAV